MIKLYYVKIDNSSGVWSVERACYLFMANIVKEIKVDKSLRLKMMESFGYNQLVRTVWLYKNKAYITMDRNRLISEIEFLGLKLIKPYAHSVYTRDMLLSIYLSIMEYLDTRMNFDKILDDFEKTNKVERYKVQKHN